MRKPSLDRHVARLAAKQQGVFARTQVGVTKWVIQRRIAAGRWERLAPSVFRLAGCPSSWRQSLLAACLAWGEGVAVSHQAAAALWRLAGFEPGPIELTVPPTRNRTLPARIHRNALSHRDVTTIDGIPVTTPARTLIDLASVAPKDLVEEALDDALRRGLVSLGRLRRAMSNMGRGRAGAAVMRALLDARDGSPTPESVFETRLLRALKKSGLPTPVVQHRVLNGGRLVAVVDFAYPEARLAIEADGYRWRSGRTRWDRDRERRNRLTLLGWLVIHVTWTDLTRRQAAVIESIRDALVLQM